MHCVRTGEAQKKNGTAAAEGGKKLVLKDLLETLTAEQEIAVFLDEFDEPDYKGAAWDCPWWLADMEIYGEMCVVDNVLEVMVRENRIN